VNDADQDGWLPKWAIADGDASQMNGDSADPILAAAYAFGVRGFDVQGALAAMVKGATEDETGHGLEIERQYLDQYESQHYVNAGSLDLTSIDYSIGGSVTLEYALDDFSIAQLAGALGRSSLAAQMMQRAHNWEYLFNPGTGYLAARGADGSFPAGPAFSTSELEPGGQTGFEEGNAIQYTWAVPQDLAALAALMGGDGAAVAKLNTFFAKLNVGRDAPQDWAGNEPSLGTPWDYDFFGAPWRTQAVVRRIADTLYGDGPVDEPGNDDLGAISSWYVWAAVGLYPETPGTSTLVLGSPLFPHIVVHLAQGKTLDIVAPSASASRPYVAALHVAGSWTSTGLPSTCGAIPDAAVARRASGAWDRPWVPGTVLRSGGALDFTLSARPDRSWGSAPGDSPPSYPAGRVPAVGFSSPAAAVTVAAGRSVTLAIGVDWVAATGTPVVWRSTAPAGISVDPDHGVIATAGGPTVGAGTGTCAAPARETQDVTLAATAPGLHVVDISMQTADGTSLPPVVVHVSVT
jgi:putative alpha-1,2-mannosidase